MTSYKAPWLFSIVNLLIVSYYVDRKSNGYLSQVGKQKVST